MMSYVESRDKRIKTEIRESRASRRRLESQEHPSVRGVDVTEYRISSKSKSKPILCTRAHVRRPSISSSEGVVYAWRYSASNPR